MGLKVLGILLLVVAAVYAENALEAEDPVENQLEDVDEMDDETEVAETAEDPTEDDDDDDDDMTEDARRKGKGKRRRRRQRFPYVLASRDTQCYCRNPRFRKARGDEAELEEDESVDAALDDQLAEMDDVDVSDEEESDEEETEVEDADARRRKGGKRRRRLAIKKLIRSFFSRRLLVRLYCHCTRNRAVIRFLRFLHISKVVHRRQRIAFFRTYHRLLKAVVRARRGRGRGKKGGKKGDAY